MKKKKEKIYRNKTHAIKYLVKNNVYTNEWTGTGMYEAIEELIENKRGRVFWSKKYLDSLLVKAINR